MKQNGFSVKVIKTTKINVDESSHALPPDNGAYREYKVADYECPEEWSKDGKFISVKEGDRLWFDFRSNDDECAILCAVQRINPVTGEPADLEEGLSKDPTQNYLRMPEQYWLDGYAKDGKVYQFVVTKAGIGLAVNEFVLPKHMQDSHAIGFAFFGPKNPKPKPVTRDVLHVHHMHPHPANFIGQHSQHMPMKIGSKSLQSWTNTKGGSPGGSDDVMRGFDGVISDYSGIIGETTSGGVLGESGIALNASSEDVAQVFCCNSADPSDLHCVGRWVDVVEEVETVDILAEQEANLTELDKASMGAGGRIVQSIVTDDNTTDYYHEKRSALLTIYFALPEMFDVIMKTGKRQDASKKDKYKTSGHIGGVAVPLITQEESGQ